MSVELGRAEGAMSGVAAVFSAIVSRFGRLLAVPLFLLVAMLSVATPAAAQDPVITSISPAWGSTAGGNRVDIFGNNFFGMVTSVTVGGVNAAIFGTIADSPAVQASDLPGWAFVVAAIVGIAGGLALLLRRYLGMTV